MNTTEIMHHNDTLFNKIVTIDQSLDELNLNKVSRNYDGFIGSIDASFNLALSNGTFSGKAECDFNAVGVYLVSINYTNNSALVDRSLYALRVNKNEILQSTMTLCGCSGGNDSLLVSFRNNEFTFSTTYTGTASGCTIRII